MNDETSGLDIAIVGLGGVFPGSVDLAQFFGHILAGADLITEIPESHFSLPEWFDQDPKAPDKIYTRRGGFLPEISFDPLKNGIPPSMLSSTDTSQLLGLLVARTTLEDAFGGRFAEADKARISVILGATSGQELFGQMAARLARPNWEAGMRAAGIEEAEVALASRKISESFVPWTESTFPGLLGNVIAGRIAHRLDTGGTNAVTDAACASSFAALSMGIDELRLGRAELVLTGGVDTLNDVFMHMCFSKTPALSPSGRCRPFDREGDGTLLGEGIGMVALKRRVDAERDGNKIYALIRGLGTSSDGRSKSVYAPVPEGQAKALRRAYEIAGYAPRTVELVEAHGTGTKAGDAAEIEGLGLVFSPEKQGDRPWCALGSVKSQIGHTKAAAGAAGLIKAALALHHKVIPPTIGISAPSAAFAEPGCAFYPSTVARPWVRGSAHPRRASVSSFGFGGSNFHVTLEEYRGPASPAPRLSPRSAEVFALSASDVSGLGRALSSLESALVGGLPLITAAAQAARAFRTQDPERLAFAADSVAEALRLCRAAQTGLPAAVPGVFRGSGPQAGKLALLFPGQGSQSLGMGATLAMESAAALAVLDQADDVRLGDRPLSSVMFPPPALEETTRAEQLALLTRTEWAQPALGASGMACFAALSALGLKAELAAGHSFGELVALAAAGAMDLETLLVLARARGEAMAEASQTPGAMIAVALSLPEAQAVAAEEGLVVANHNAPEQCVLSGPAASIDRAEAALGRRGLSVRRLGVATAFHSPLVASAVGKLRSALSSAALRLPRIPVYSCLTASPEPTELEALAEGLAEQLAAPVRFVEQIQAMSQAGARVFVEAGPGTVLSGLVGRILADVPDAIAIPTDGPRGLAGALARLCAAGVPFDLAAHFGDRALPPAPLPEAPGTVRLLGSNYGKPNLPPPAPPTPARERRPVMTEQKPPPPRRPTPEGGAWLEVLRESQRQAADAHVAFQKTMTDAHLAFLQAMESSSRALAQALGGAPGELPRPSVVQAQSVPAIAALPRPVTPVPNPAPRPAPPPPKEAPPRAAPVEKPQTEETPVELFLRIVADKTGYPREALALSMSLEADLGIDSIKRVEILGAFKERSTRAIDLDPLKLAKLKTLGEIAGALGPSNGVAHHGNGTNGAHKTASAPSLLKSEIFLRIVAEKTGYPREALALSMSLEADLGIDSIKRVEILGAFKERAPEAPVLDPLALAKLKTLGDIASALDGEVPAVAAEPARPAVNAPAPAPTPAPTPGEPLRRRAVSVGPLPSRQGRPFQPPAGLPVAIVEDVLGVAPILAELLEKRGLRVLWVKKQDPLPAALAGYIDLSALGLRPAVGQASRLLSAALLRAGRAAPALRATPSSFYVVAFDAGGDFGRGPLELGQAALAGLSGLAKTAALEWPTVAVKAIDLSTAERDAEELARQLLDELLRGFDFLEVGLTRAARVGPKVIDATLSRREAPELGAHPVVLVSGGARGVTAWAMEALARALRPSFILLGRTDIGAPEPSAASGLDADWKIKAALVAAAKAEKRTVPLAEIGRETARILAAREVKKQIAALEAIGSKVHYAAVDVSDPTALAAALESARRALGPITAVVHGAGALADRSLEEKTEEQVAGVLGPKVLGLSAILDATASDPLGLLVVFSSVAGRFGNVGQADYAMANEAITRMAEGEAARRGGALRVKSIAWGPWEGGMVTPALAKRFLERGVRLISRDAGAQAFVDELALGAQPAEVVLGDGAGAVTTALLHRIDARSHAYLIDHAVHGVPVLPVALALELAAELAASSRSDQQITRIRGLRVLRGVRLARFRGEGDELELLATEAEDGRLAVELRTPGVVAPHYQATIELKKHRDPAPKAARVGGLEPYGPSLDHVYQELLFHGPAFQLVDAVEGVSSKAMVAKVRGVRDAAWPDRSWHLDAAAIDAALQLVLLWARHTTQGAFLPTAIGEVVLYAAPASPGPLRAILSAAEAPHETRVLANVQLVDAEDRVVFEMLGVEAHRLPEDTAFRPSQDAERAPLA
ncbi:MAG: SDR family NAD(P)-dependent oxidoreductase [Myxococcota bacterium]